MTRLEWIAVFVNAAIASTCAAQTAREVATDEIALTEACRIRFATPTEGAAHLKKPDRFLKSLSRFDRQSRLRTTDEVTFAAVGEFAAKQALRWTDSEIARMQKIVESARNKMSGYALPMPESILLIKTTGKEECNAPHCRTNAVIFPQRSLSKPAELLEWILIHELFHVLSSHNPELRRELYAIMGFKPCKEVELPESLRDRKITNPDAPGFDYYIELMVDGEQQFAVPLQYADVADYDPKRGISMFAYRSSCLMVVERDGDQWRAVQRAGEAVLLDPVTTKSYLDQIGRNTRYIIHPEEALAENFTHLMFKTSDLPTPRIIRELSELLSRQ